MVDLNRTCIPKKHSLKRSIYNDTANNPKSALYQQNKSYPKNAYMRILAKQNYTVFGTGYECRISEVKTIIKTDIWNKVFPPIKSISSLQITPEKCWDLVYTKTCNDGEIMKCDSSSCYSLEQDYSNEYSWWNEKIFTSKKCSFAQKEIIAHEITSPLFGNQDCNSQSGYCYLTDSIIVWNSTLITHNCPYSYATINRFIFKEISPNIMYTGNDNLIFEIIGTEDVCDPPMSIFKTTEGLYLVNEPITSRHTQIANTNINTNIESKFILAENDANKETEIKLYRELNIRNCLSITNTLNIISKTRNNFYFTIKDINGNNLILYTQNYNVYVPNCKIIETIDIDYETYQCHEDIPIIIKGQYSDENLFLTAEKILKKDSKIIDCRDENFNIILPLKNKTTLNRFYNFTSNRIIYDLKNKHEPLQYINLLNNNLTELNFLHFDKIIEYINFHTLEHDGLAHTDGRFVKPSANEIIHETILNKLKNKLLNIYEYWYHIKIILISIAVLFTVLIFIYTTIRIIILIKKYRIRNQKLKEINLIKGFLPEPNASIKRVNQVKRWDSSDSLDPITLQMLTKIKNNRF